VIVHDAVAVLLDHRHLNHVANNDVHYVAVAAMGNKTVDGDDQDEVGAVDDHAEMMEDNDDVHNMMVVEEGVLKKKDGCCQMKEGQDE